MHPVKGSDSDADQSSPGKFKGGKGCKGKGGKGNDADEWEMMWKGGRVVRVKGKGPGKVENDNSDDGPYYVQGKGQVQGKKGKVEPLHGKNGFRSIMCCARRNNVDINDAGDSNDDCN